MRANEMIARGFDAEAVAQVDAKDWLPTIRLYGDNLRESLAVVDR